MRFSCDRCGQRYFSVDEPSPGQRYGIPCVACGGALLLEGGDFPALPTDAVDAKGSPSQGGIPDATRETPLRLALAPPARQEPPVVAPQPSSPGAERPRAAATGRRLPPAAVILATAGAGVLLFVGAQRLLGGGRGHLALQPAQRHELGRAPTAGLPPDSSLPEPAEAQGVTSPSPGPGTPFVSKGPPGRLEPAARVVTGPSTVPDPRPTRQAHAGSVPSTAERVAAAVAARRPDLDACLRESAKSEPGLLIGRRPFHLVLTVDPSGIVTQARIDDPVIQDAAGPCLRVALSRLVFPMFPGEPVKVRVPLTGGGE